MGALALAALAAPLAALNAGCGVGYVATQGYYQLKLLKGREPIAEVLERPEVAADEREKLRLIVDVQGYAASALGMDPSGTYTTVNLGWDTTIYNVSASKPLAFEPHTWWFPIVGRVPYKGFFREEDAARERDALLKKGLDVAMRAVGAYSTLGWFEDPVLPGMLGYGRLGLVDLVFHELAHGVLYFKGQVDFNESFASFVGKHASFEYLDARAGTGLPTSQDARDRYDDMALSQQFMHQLYEELDAVYHSDRPDAEKLAAKAAALASAQERYAALPFRSEGYRGRRLPELNNADLMSYKRYFSGESSFNDVLVAHGGRWPDFFAAVASLEDSEDPFADLARLAHP